VSKRIFIAFAIEDERYRDFLKGQANNENSPFEFTDMSAKAPWDEKWKTNCRSRIRGCDGVIGLISKNTPKATGQLWELQCSYDEGKPVMLMWISDERPSLPAPLKDKRVNIWSWDNIKTFISKL